MELALLNKEAPMKKQNKNNFFLKGRGKGGEGGHVFMVKDGGNHCVCVYGAGGGV